MSIGRYEKQLINVLEKNPHINTRKFIQLAGLGKTTFYKYTKSLEIEGYISFEMFKNEKEWYLMRKKKNQDWGLVDFETSKKKMDQRFEELESKITKAIRKAKEGKTAEKAVGYGDSVLLLLSTLGMFKLIYYYRKKRTPDLYVQFEKKLERLLEKIADEKYFSEYGYGRIPIDNVIREAEERLDEFLGIQRKYEIY